MIDIIDIVCYILFHQGLQPVVKKWAEIPENKYKHVLCPKNYGDEYEYDKLEIIWMICVFMFGDYGTSPRYGWIEDVDEFREFINDVTLTPTELYDKRHHNENN